MSVFTDRSFEPNAALRLLERRDFAFPIYVLPSWMMLVKTAIPLLVICDKPMLKAAWYLHRHSNFRGANTRNLTCYGSFIKILRAKEMLKCFIHRHGHARNLFDPRIVAEQTCHIRKPSHLILDGPTRVNASI